MLNRNGEAIALNAAGKMGTAASFYLPLYRVKRAVDLIRKGGAGGGASFDVPRGDIQASFELKPFDELMRLGLPAVIEQRVRRGNPTSVGMLVVTRCGPQGAAQVLPPPPPSPPPPSFSSKLLTTHNVTLTLPPPVCLLLAAPPYCFVAAARRFEAWGHTMQRRRRLFRRDVQQLLRSA